MPMMTTKHVVLAAVAAMAVTSFAGAQQRVAASATESTAAAAPSVTSTPVSGSVQENVDRIAAMVQAAGGTVFARIDHGAGAESVGLKLAPAVVLLFGNPKVGTPLMQRAPAMGLDLPSRVLVHEVDGATVLTYHRPEALANAYGLPADHPSIVKLSGLLAKFSAKH